MYSYHEVEFRAHIYQQERLREAEQFRLAKMAARRQRSTTWLQHLMVGLVAVYIKLGVMAFLLIVAALLGQV